jgi:anti-sigma factor RsiW
MTDCPRADIRDALPDWVNGSLDESLAADVAEHVATCGACAAESELLRDLRGVLVREPQIDVPRIAETVTARTLGGTVEAPVRRWWRPVLGGVAVAASAVFVGILLQPPDGPESTTVQPRAELAVGGALSDLREDQLEVLLRRLDGMDALPQTSPAPAIITAFEVRE